MYELHQQLQTYILFYKYRPTDHGNIHIEDRYGLA